VYVLHFSSANWEPADGIRIAQRNTAADLLTRRAAAVLRSEARRA
jgi:hypothetical protein